MVIQSLAASFIPVAILALQMESPSKEREGIVRGFSRATLKIILTFFTACVLNSVLKVRGKNLPDFDHSSSST